MCMYVCKCECVYEHVCMCVRACIYVCECVCEPVCVYAFVRLLFSYANVFSELKAQKFKFVPSLPLSIRLYHSYEEDETSTCQIKNHLCT